MRIFDIILSFIVIILFSPVGLIISIILKLTGEGEIFYLQKRIGQYSRPFSIIKFATMVKNSPNIGAKDITLQNDSRVLPFGRLLRKTKLNEFPQFINVFIGNMSIVGPRPLVNNQYQMIPKQYIKKISLLKPGITGIGSIIFRDEERFLNNLESDSNIFYKNKIVPFKSQLELWYFNNKSILNNIIIIILTVLSIIKPNNKFHNNIFTSIPKHSLFNPD